MDATWSITAFVVIDNLMTALKHKGHPLAQASDAEVLTVAIVAAKYFQNHHERALCVMRECNYLSGQLSTSRFNRRLHALGDWLLLAAETLGELFTTGETYVIDSMPVPVCRRVRAWRCRKVRGRIYCGYCAAKDEKFFGWRLHLVCTLAGEPVRFTLLPASWHTSFCPSTRVEVWSVATLLADCADDRILAVKVRVEPGGAIVDALGDGAHGECGRPLLGDNFACWGFAVRSSA